MDDTYFNENFDCSNLDGNKDEKVFVCGDGIDKAYEDFIIVTTVGNILNMLEQINNDYKRKVCSCCWKKEGGKSFNEVASNVKKYSPEQLRSFKVNEPEKYAEWINDVMFFYCLRSLLFQRGGKTIKKFRMPITPIRNMSPGQMRDEIVKSYNENQRKIDENNDE